VHFCLAENKEVKAGSNPREKLKSCLPKEPELLLCCLTDKKEVKAGSTQERKETPAYLRSLSSCTSVWLRTKR
jgi:hypothetical protein